MRAHAHVAFDTPLAPDRVVATLVDFSAERPAIWPGLDPRTYRVRELGRDCAVVDEGSRRPRIRARERYDWSTPGRVSWRTEESDVFAPGSGLDVVVSPLADGGGSHVEIDAWRVAAASARGYLVVALLALFGRGYLVAAYKGVFDRVAAQEAATDVEGR
jgi:hypothetical protein